jgi:hypothetical protein
MLIESVPVSAVLTGEPECPLFDPSDPPPHPINMISINMNGK